MFSVAAGAASIGTGTANSASFGAGGYAGPAPAFGTLITFDDQYPANVNGSLPSNAYVADGVASIVNKGTAPLIADPYSQQSSPIDITTGQAANYTGDILITFTSPANEVGIGVMGDGTTPVTLNIFDASKNLIAGFTEPADPSFNAYYYITDSSYDIQSFEISAPAGLAIDDLQFTATPEPVNFALAGMGLGALALLRRRSKKA